MYSTKPRPVATAPLFICFLVWSSSPFFLSFILLPLSYQYPLTMTSSTLAATLPATEDPPPPFSTSTTKA